MKIIFYEKLDKPLLAYCGSREEAFDILSGSLLSSNLDKIVKSTVEKTDMVGPGNGWVYTCLINPKRKLVVPSEEEMLSIRNDEKGIKKLIKEGYDLIEYPNLEHSSFIILNPDIITITKKTKHSPKEAGYSYNRSKKIWE